MSIRPTTPITLNVLIPEAEEFGLGKGAYIEKSVLYTNDVIIQKTWDNLPARVWEAVSHVFCTQVCARDTNKQTGDFENKIFWVKGEVTTQPKITSSLDEPAPKRPASPASSTSVESDSSLTMVGDQQDPIRTKLDELANEGGGRRLAPRFRNTI